MRFVSAIYRSDTKSEVILRCYASMALIHDSAGQEPGRVRPSAGLHYSKTLIYRRYISQHIHGPCEQQKISNTSPECTRKNDTVFTNSPTVKLSNYNLVSNNAAAVAETSTK